MPGEKHIAPISENSLARMGTPVFSTWPTLGALLKGVLVDNSGDLCIRQVQAKKTGQSTEFTERTLTQGLIPGLGTEFRVPVVPPVSYPPHLVIQDVFNIVVNSLFQAKGTKLAVENMPRVDLRDVVIPAHNHIPQIPVGDDVALSASLENSCVPFRPREMKSQDHQLMGKPLKSLLSQVVVCLGCVPRREVTVALDRGEHLGQPGRP